MKLKFFLLLSVFSLLGISCASDGGTEQVPVSGGSSSEIAESIVSLSPTATEILFAIGAGEQVIAVFSGVKGFLDDVELSKIKDLHV